MGVGGVSADLAPTRRRRSGFPERLTRIEKAKSQAKVYDELSYRHWDEWEDGAYSHIFVRRAGDTAKGTVSTWEDVHAVFERWSGLLDERLESLRDGTFKPRLTIKEKNPPVAESQRQ